MTVKKVKKKYIKPKIKSEKVFEKAAMACGKCISGPYHGHHCKMRARLS